MQNNLESFSLVLHSLVCVYMSFLSSECPINFYTNLLPICFSLHVQQLSDTSQILTQVLLSLFPFIFIYAHKGDSINCLMYSEHNDSNIKANESFVKLSSSFSI